MTYGEFKDKLVSAMFNDTKIPDEDSVLIPIVMRELHRISSVCTPLSLVVDIPDYRIRRVLGDGYFLRESDLIVDEESVIDLDKELLDALVFFVASKISLRNKEGFYNDAFAVISDFNFKIMEAQENECW